MDLYQEVVTCLSCGTRLTVCGQRLRPSGQVTAYDVACPVCWAEVSFAIPGVIDPAKACLICYERPPKVEKTVPTAPSSRRSQSARQGPVPDDRER